MAEPPSWNGIVTSTATEFESSTGTTTCPHVLEVRRLCRQEGDVGSQLVIVELHGMCRQAAESDRAGLQVNDDRLGTLEQRIVDQGEVDRRGRLTGEDHDGVR